MGFDRDNLIKPERAVQRPEPERQRKEKDERNAKFIASPRSGDIFEIKTSNNQYTLYKVTLVQGDSVFVAPSNYETNKKTGLADLKKKEFSAELMGFSLGDLKRMLEEDEIVDVDR